MRRLGLALTLGVLMAGTSAYAQSYVQVDLERTTAGTSVGTSQFDAGQQLGYGANRAPPNENGGGGDYNSYVTVGEQFITFESENTVSGPSVALSSYSDVVIDLHNETGQSVLFKSTITPAGLGFYLADTANADCLYTGCAPASGHGLSFSQLSGAGVLATVGFEFSVSRDGGDGSIYSLDGYLSLFRNTNGAISVIDGLGTGIFGDGTGARGGLSGFSQATDSATNLGFTWNATEIEFDIGDYQDQTLIYSTRVTSFSSTSCIGESFVCLVAYSGFGDPVGRGGGVLSRSTTAMSGGDGVTFGPTTLEIPTFEDGVLTFRSAGAVPEPATWLAMILGFGLLGTALRRRRALAFT